MRLLAALVQWHWYTLGASCQQAVLGLLYTNLYLVMTKGQLSVSEVGGQLASLLFTTRITCRSDWAIGTCEDNLTSYISAHVVCSRFPEASL